MNDIEKVLVEIKPNSSGTVKIQTVNANGSMEQKNITCSALASILLASHDAGGNGDLWKLGLNRIPKLPHGYYAGAISTERERTFSCAVVIPEGQRTFLYRGESFFIPMPPMLFISKVVKGHQVESYLYVLDSECVTDASQLYEYPFANVYADGRICWGNNVVSGLESLKDIEGVVALLLDSPSNDDLLSLPGNFQTQREFLMYLKEKKRFPRPANLLNPCGCVEDALRKVMIF